MFGYILPLKAELKVKEFELYRAYYCGLCKQMHKSFGVASRMLLNYDLVLLALMRDAVQDTAYDFRFEGCMVNPVGKQATLHGTQGLALGADGLIMMTYHKIRDDLQDEPFFKRIGLYFTKMYLEKKYRKAALRRPALAKVLQEQMLKQWELEKATCVSVDNACDPTAQMCAALFAEAGESDRQKAVLNRLGLFSGQIVYLLDAAADYDEDKKSGSYNVFLANGKTKEETIEMVRMRCNMAAGEMAACYNLLDLKKNKPILDNIFFLGVKKAIQQTGTQNNGRNKKHGQIDSI